MVVCSGLMCRMNPGLVGEDNDGYQGKPRTLLS